MDSKEVDLFAGEFDQEEFQEAHGGDFDDDEEDDDMFHDGGEFFDESEFDGSYKDSDF